MCNFKRDLCRATNVEVLLLPSEGATATHTILDHISVVPELVKDQLLNLHSNLCSASAIEIFCAKHACQPEEVLVPLRWQMHLTISIHAAGRQGTTVRSFVCNFASVKIQEAIVREAALFVRATGRWPRKVYPGDGQAQGPGIFDLDLCPGFNEGHNAVDRQTYLEMETSWVFTLPIAVLLSRIRWSYSDHELVGLIFLWQKLPARTA
mmetsp:Transcript_62199/g.145768  ORF Transcript_62199/g.145768 Transcript_62199/m.145768 type:complete len:208 (+) Transcript_62199:162-785(+)